LKAISVSKRNVSRELEDLNVSEFTVYGYRTHRMISFCFSSSCFCRIRTFSICIRSWGVRCDRSGISSMAPVWRCPLVELWLWSKYVFE